MTLGITDMADGMEVGTTRITATCTLTTADGTAVGTHIGATTRTITTTATILRLRVRHSIAPTTLVLAMTTAPATTTQQAQVHRQVAPTATSTATV